MKQLYILVLLFLAILVESSITTIPIVLSIILILYIFTKSPWVFLAAFISGLFLDIFSVRTLGQTSLFLITFLFIITLYERKFEIATNYFVLFSSFFGSLIFLIIFGYNYAFPAALASSIFAFLTFRLSGVFSSKNLSQN